MPLLEKEWNMVNLKKPPFTRTTGPQDDVRRNSDYVLCKYANKIHHADRNKDMAYRLLRYEKHDQNDKIGSWYCPIEQTYVPSPDRWIAFID